MNKLRGELKEYEPMASYTSWRVGGPSRRFYRPADLADLSNFMQTVPENEDLTWIGLGSNVLIRDGGIPGTVILTLGALNKIELLPDNIVRAEAGITCAKLAKFCARQGFAHSSFFAGIPGTVGGALAMNAGAFGGITWDHVREVETIDRHGKIRLRNREDFKISYRETNGPAGEWFVAGHFCFSAHEEPAKLENEIRELLRKRSSSQPIGKLSCGSVFRNPPGDYAARLIDSCGLKGTRIGGAWVSEKHANFILNAGEATAKDIESLICLVAEKVEKTQQVRLIPEVHIIGENDYD